MNSDSRSFLVNGGSDTFSPAPSFFDHGRGNMIPRTAWRPSFACTSGASGSSLSRSRLSGTRAAQTSVLETSFLQKEVPANQEAPWRASPPLLPFRPMRRTLWAWATSSFLWGLVLKKSASSSSAPSSFSYHCHGSTLTFFPVTFFPRPLRQKQCWEKQVQLVSVSVKQISSSKDSNQEYGATKPSFVQSLTKLPAGRWQEQKLKSRKTRRHERNGADESIEFSGHTDQRRNQFRVAIVSSCWRLRGTCSPLPSFVQQSLRHRAWFAAFIGVAPIAPFPFPFSAFGHASPSCLALLPRGSSSLRCFCSAQYQGMPDQVVDFWTSSCWMSLLALLAVIPPAARVGPSPQLLPPSSMSKRWILRRRRLSATCVGYQALRRTLRWHSASPWRTRCASFLSPRLDSLRPDRCTLCLCFACLLMWEVRYWPKGQTPRCAKCTWDLAPMKSTWKRKREKSRFRKKKWKTEKDTEESKVRIEERENKQSLRRMTHGGMTRTNTWTNVVSHIITRARCEREKGDVWGVLFTHSVGCSRLLSTYCNKFKNEIFSWAPPAFVPIPPWWTGRRRVPPLVQLKRNWFCTFFSWFSVETVHYCDCGSEVWSKSRRCISARFVQCEIPIFLYLSYSSEDGQQEWSSCASLCIAMHFSSVQPILSCESRYAGSRWKRSWIPS